LKRAFFYAVLITRRHKILVVGRKIPLNGADAGRAADYGALPRLRKSRGLRLRRDQGCCGEPYRGRDAGRCA
jgi:hypothetical protein